MKITWNRVKLALLTLLVVIVAVAFLYDPLDYEHDTDRRLPADFQTYYQQQLEAGQQAGVRPGNEVRLVRFADRTEYTILFIHGFGASRAGGEAVVDVIANELQANTYYMRLPGHGTNAEDHAAHDFREYLDATEDAFAMLPKLGDKIILIGSSTGALLTTYLASKYPDRVYAMIMASPLYEFANPSAAMFDVPGGIYVVEALYGPDRNAGWDDPRKQPGYEDHWQIDQKFRAVKNLADLRRYIVSDTTYGRITAPTLLFYYYKNEQEQDNVVSVPAMLEALSQFGKFSQPHPLNRAVAVAEGYHILMSKYVASDKQFILSEMRTFLDAVRQSESMQ